MYYADSRRKKKKTFITDQWRITTTRLPSYRGGKLTYGTDQVHLKWIPLPMLPQPLPPATPGVLTLSSSLRLAVKLLASALLRGHRIGGGGRRGAWGVSECGAAPWGNTRRKASEEPNASKDQPHIQKKNSCGFLFLFLSKLTVPAD